MVAVIGKFHLQERQWLHQRYLRPFHVQDRCQAEEISCGQWFSRQYFSVPLVAILGLTLESIFCRHYSMQPIRAANHRSEAASFPIAAPVQDPASLRLC